MTDDRVQMKVRLSRGLKHEIDDYAKTLGIPASAAAVVLIAKGLMLDDHRRLTSGSGAASHSPDPDQSL